VKKAWPWALGLVGAIAYFGYFETMAFLEPGQYDTLSHVVSTIGAKWPLAIYICGFFSGGLATHFFWPWAANPMGPGAG
jgi:hypothetical protein